MNITQSIILGIIQGITEFLPVSSSGHLIFLPKLFGWGDQGMSFDIMVHLGTLLAVVFYFRKKISVLIRCTVSKKECDLENKNLGHLLILTVIPAGIVGLLFGDFIEQHARSASIVGFNLIFWGIILIFANMYSKKHFERNTHRRLRQMDTKNALFIGCAQAIALVPGVSRSGITMTAGLFSRFTKHTAAEFSFLMSIPVIFLAGMVNLSSLVKTGFESVEISVLLAGFLASAVSGFFAIWFLMGVIKKWSFIPFSVYRIVVGVLIFIFLV
jgi:undecaprenyl-diphosphatase